MQSRQIDLLAVRGGGVLGTAITLLLNHQVLLLAEILKLVVGEFLLTLLLLGLLRCSVKGRCRGGGRRHKVARGCLAFSELNGRIASPILSLSRSFLIRSGACVAILIEQTIKNLSVGICTFHLV